jgi:hypothetical protein
MTGHLLTSPAALMSLNNESNIVTSLGAEWRNSLTEIYLPSVPGDRIRTPERYESRGSLPRGTPVGFKHDRATHRAEAGAPRRPTKTIDHVSLLIAGFVTITVIPSGPGCFIRRSRRKPATSSGGLPGWACSWSAAARCTASCRSNPSAATTAARTSQRYLKAGLITPDLRLPSGRYRWDVERLRAQINALPVNVDE